MPITSFDVIVSHLAVMEDGKEPREIQVDRGGFFARLFDPDPTLPLWQKTKPRIVMVPHWKPVIFRLMDKIIVHPSLYEALRKELEK